MDKIKPKERLTGLIIKYKLGVYKSSKEGKKDTIYIFIITPTPSKEFTKQWEIEDAKWFNLNNLPEDIGMATLRRITEYKEGGKEIEGI